MVDGQIRKLIDKKTGSPLRGTRHSFGYSLFKEIEGRFSFLALILFGLDSSPA